MTPDSRELWSISLVSGNIYEVAVTTRIVKSKRCHWQLNAFNCFWEWREREGLTFVTSGAGAKFCTLKLKKRQSNVPGTVSLTSVQRKRYSPRRDRRIGWHGTQMSADVNRITVGIFMVPLEVGFWWYFAWLGNRWYLTICSNCEKAFMRTVALGGRLLRDLWVFAYSIKQNLQRRLTSVRNENEEGDSLISLITGIGAPISPWGSLGQWYRPSARRIISISYSYDAMQRSLIQQFPFIASGENPLQSLQTRVPDR